MGYGDEGGDVTVSRCMVQDLAEFLATNGVDVVASLPCYSQANVDVQVGYKTKIQNVAIFSSMDVHDHVCKKMSTFGRFIMK